MARAKKPYTIPITFEDVNRYALITKRDEYDFRVEIWDYESEENDIPISSEYFDTEEESAAWVFSETTRLGWLIYSIRREDNTGPYFADDE